VSYRHGLLFPKIEKARSCKWDLPDCLAQSILRNQPTFVTVSRAPTLRYASYRSERTASITPSVKFCRRFIICLLLCIMHCPGAEPLRTLAEVHALSDHAAQAGQPVRVEAVVLYVDPSNGDTIIHDGTAACYNFIHFNAGESPNNPKIGDRLLVEGITKLLGVTPHVESQTWTLLGPGEIPEPQRLTADELHSSRIDVAWIEVPAVVIGVETGGIAYTLAVEVFGRTFKADVPASPDAALRASALMQRPARMRAILGTVYNQHRQMIGRHFYVPSFDDIIPISPAADESPAPLLTAIELLGRNFSPTDLVRVEGVVTQEDAKGFHLRDGSGSVRVQAVMTGRLPPGARVGIEGYGAIAPFRPLLRATKVTRISNGPPPEPVAMMLQPDFQSMDSSLLQMELVSVEADFLGSRDTHSETLLQCRAQGMIFEAILPHSSRPLPEFIPGDRLKLTGICELTTTHPLPRPEWVNGFRILLANPDAVMLLHRAPWWTTGRLFAALSAMTGLAVLSTLGTLFFRRVVRKQALVIGEKLGDEAVSDERDRMARDLHDTLEQQLAGVALQLDGLDKVAENDPSQISSRLGLARQMLRHTRVEARRSVWDLRSKVLEIQGLGTALRSMAAGSSSDEGPSVVLDICELTRPLPPGSDFHLLRIGQEALANAIKHASASEVVISLRETADAVQLTVRDDGCGFVPASPEAPVTSHFGILGIHERVNKIGASLDIQSSPGHGCTVSVTFSNPHTP
jgi:signal transduction histidine kinase